MRALAALLLLASCAQPSRLVFEASAPPPGRAAPQRVLVATNGPLLSPGEAEAHAAALARELSSCPLQTTVVVSPPDADISLEGDVLARLVAERSRAFRPDAILAIAVTGRTTRGYMETAYAYDIQLRSPGGQPVMRATARFSPEPGRDATGDLARLMVAELAKAGVLPCPGRRA